MDKRGQSNYIFRINIITPTTLLVVAIKLGYSDAGDLGKTRLGGLQVPELQVMIYYFYHPPRPLFVCQDRFPLGAARYGNVDLQATVVLCLLRQRRAEVGSRGRLHPQAVACY